MKYFRGSRILCILAVAFLLFGAWGGYLGSVWEPCETYVTKALRGNIQSLSDLFEKIDERSTKKLFYHDNLLDLHSLKEKWIGTRAVKKDGDYYLRADSGSIVKYRDRPSEAYLGKLADRVKDLQGFVEEQGGNFLYVSIPNKEYYEEFPGNFENNSPETYDSFLNLLKEREIPYYDFDETVRDQGLVASEQYLSTDHHWTTHAGFLANEEMCKVLEETYGFSYEEAYLDLENYHIETYEDYWIGANGRKAGRFFGNVSAEDVEFIVPDFPTEFTEERPMEDKLRYGDFSQTILYKDVIEKWYYHNSLYACYLGGNFPLQILRNHANPEGKTFVVVKDSFSRVILPYLALQAGEVHMIDLRLSTDAEERVQLRDYIREIDPDYVLVIFNAPISSDLSNGKFDFE